MTGPSEWEQLLARAAEFLDDPPPPVEAEPGGPGKVIAAEGLVRAEAEPYLVDGVPPLPQHPPAVVDDEETPEQTADADGEVEDPWKP